MNNTIQTGIEDADKNKIIRVIDALIPGAKIYLFGSRARGTYQRTSDIDVAVDARQKLERTQIAEVKDMLNASDIIRKIDIVDIHNIPEEMRTTLLKEAIVWKD